ncbi:hypothetical protein AB1N83_011061 [Pleurotus pulmonarius]
MSFSIDDEDKAIRTWYWVHLEGVSLDFGTTWTQGSEVRIFKKDRFSEGRETEMRRRYDALRSLECAPRTPVFINEGEDIIVQYIRCNDGLPRIGVIAGWEDVEALAQGAAYQGGISHLEIHQELGFVESTVRFMARTASEYYGDRFFELSVVIENIHRNEWKELLEYQQQVGEQFDGIVDNVPCVRRGSEHVIEQMPESPWQNDKRVTHDLKHVAHESMALVLKHHDAQIKAVQQGLSLDDFLWQFPNHHEMRVVRSPSAQTDIPLRAARVDITLFNDFSTEGLVRLFLARIDVVIISMTRSPSRPHAFSSCTLRLDAPYAALANATIPNHPSQIIEINTDLRATERVITANSLTPTINVHVVQIVGPVAGDVFAAPIHGGNNGGRNNTITTSTPHTNSRRSGGGFFLRRFELLPGLRGIFRMTKPRRGHVQQGVDDTQ